MAAVAGAAADHPAAAPGTGRKGDLARDQGLIATQRLSIMDYRATVDITQLSMEVMVCTKCPGQDQGVPGQEDTCTGRWGHPPEPLTDP